LIVTVRPDGEGVKYDYYLSNDLTASAAELVRVILGSHRVEDCFRRAKGSCGLADYEVQTWQGWHHHVTMSMLACWFLTQESLRGKKRVCSVDGFSCGTLGGGKVTALPPAFVPPILV
jgi:SRSO17 transposase